MMENKEKELLDKVSEDELRTMIRVKIKSYCDGFNVCNGCVYRGKDNCKTLYLENFLRGR